MIYLIVLTWLVIGFVVVRYTDDGVFAMLAYNTPKFTLFLYLLAVITWPIWKYVTVLAAYVYEFCEERFSK